MFNFAETRIYIAFSLVGAVALAEFLADSTMLLRIDLRDNEIKTGGLMALSHAMRVNSSVTRIDLDKDTKKESVSLTVKTLKDISLQHNLFAWLFDLS